MYARARSSRGGRVGGKRKHNSGPGSGLALRPNAPAVRFDDAAAYVEAQPQPASAIFPPCLGESLEDGIEGAVGYAGTRIYNRQSNAGNVLLSTNDYFAALGSEPERIGDEVGQHLRLMRWP